MRTLKSLCRQEIIFQSRRPFGMSCALAKSDQLRRYLRGIASPDCPLSRLDCEIDDSLQSKEKGDRSFVAGRFFEAWQAYTAALASTERLQAEVLQVTLLLNRGAANLKLELYEQVSRRAVCWCYHTLKQTRLSTGD